MFGLLFSLLSFKRKKKPVSIKESTFTFTESKRVLTKVKTFKQRWQPVRMTRAERKEQRQKAIKSLNMQGWCNGSTSQYFD